MPGIIGVTGNSARQVQRQWSGHRQRQREIQDKGSKEVSQMIDMQT
ncbi:MAG: hypothetical protein RMJ48_00315 [Roseiflexaceae bacterium]|nr:hypothetical protein [Roseiflexaceae bacterium]